MRNLVVLFTILALVAVDPVIGCAKGKKGRLNQSITVTLHEGMGHQGTDYADIGLNASFTVDHEAIILCHGVRDAVNSEDYDLLIAVFVDGQEDPDPMRWRTNGAPKAFLRSVTVPPGEHTISVRIKPAQSSTQPGVGAVERRMVVQVF